MIMLGPSRSTVMAPTACEHIVERAHALLDGELGAESAVALRAHITACPACAHVAAAEERFVRAVRARLHLDRAPSSLRARVRTLLGERALGERAIGERA